LNMLDRMLRILMNKDEYMGGKCIVLMGDLRQCPPVVRGGKRPQVAADSIIHGESWTSFKVHRLHKNMRVERMILQYPERRTELHSELCILVVKHGQRKTARAMQRSD